MPRLQQNCPSIPHSITHHLNHLALLSRCPVLRPEHVNELLLMLRKVTSINDVPVFFKRGEQDSRPTPLQGQVLKAQFLEPLIDHPSNGFVHGHHQGITFAVPTLHHKRCHPVQEPHEASLLVHVPSLVVSFIPDPPQDVPRIARDSPFEAASDPFQQTHTVVTHVVSRLVFVYGKLEILPGLLDSRTELISN